MLSLARCRKLLPGGYKNVSDEELLELLDELYALSEVIVAKAEDELSANRGRFQAATEKLPPNERDEVDERAAIMEFDGGLRRDEAERAAIGRELKKKRKRRRQGRNRDGKRAKGA